MIVQQEVMWCHRNSNTHYTGGYPNGYLAGINEILGHSDNILHLFSGTINNKLSIDFNPKLRPKICASAEHIPLKDNCVARVMADPPYDENYTQYYTDLRDHQPRTKSKYKSYGFVKEAARILKPGDHLVILHWLVYKSCHGLKFQQIIPIHNGPNHRIRVATILRKPGYLPTLERYF